MAKFNFYLGESASSLLLVILVIITEVSDSFNNLLKLIFTHHWIGKAVLMVLVFFIFGLIFRRDIEKEADKKIAWYSVIVSLSIIFLFFVVLFFVE